MIDDIHEVHILLVNDIPVEAHDSIVTADRRAMEENEKSGATVSGGIWHVKVCKFSSVRHADRCFFCTLPIVGQRARGSDRVMQAPVCAHCLERVRYEQEHIYNPEGLSLYNCVRGGQWAPEKVWENLKLAQEKNKELEKNAEGHEKIAEIAAAGNAFCEAWAEIVDADNDTHLSESMAELLNKWREAIGL